MTAQKPAELLACPFCGGRANIYENQVDFITKWSVGCGDCNANLDVCEDSPQEAAEAWNTRLAAAPCPGWEETELELLVNRLAGAELNYRSAFERFGADNIETGRCWDKMRRAGNAIRAIDFDAPALGMAGVRGPVVSIKPMQLSDGRADYFVLIKVGEREVAPHVFREEYKAAYHVALYDWLLNGVGEEPDVVEFGPNDWPARPASTRPDGLGGAGEIQALSEADRMISQIEERFPNWRSYRDLVDCIDCTLHALRGGR